MWIRRSKDDNRAPWAAGAIPAGVMRRLPVRMRGCRPIRRFRVNRLVLELVLRGIGRVSDRLI